MSIGAATAWSSGIVLAFWVLMVMTARREGGAVAGDLISNSACQAVAYLLGLFLILRAHAPNTSIRGFIGVRATSAAFYPLAVLLGVAVQVPIQSLYAVISRRWPSPPDSEDRLVRLFTESSTPKRVAVGALLVLLGPLVEEIFFRGALFRPLRKRYPALIVVTLTSIFFSVSHAVPQMFVPIAIVGACMGFLRAESGSLVPSFLLHATFNAVPFYALATSLPGGEMLQDDAMPPLWITGASSLIAAALFGVIYVVGARSSAASRAREEDLS